MSDIIAIIEPIEQLTIATSVPEEVSVMTDTDPSRSLQYMEDVNLNNLTDGSVLVYKSSTAKWTATTLLNQQTMEAGEF
jgi:hypothetical protein